MDELIIHGSRPRIGGSLSSVLLLARTRSIPSRYRAICELRVVRPNGQADTAPEFTLIKGINWDSVAETS
jgi:hypothetical protein